MIYNCKNVIRKGLSDEKQIMRLTKLAMESGVSKEDFKYFIKKKQLEKGRH